VLPGGPFQFCFGRCAPGRIHNHDAGRTQLFPDEGKNAHPQIQRNAARLQDRASLSKQQILELYINQIYLGQRAYGFAAAAQTYFGKPLAQAHACGEHAMLAGLPKAPSRFNPVTNPARAKLRQQYVLGACANSA
jgi:membrane carboxypeptidase/penicillin-binding protein PbpC